MASVQFVDGRTEQVPCDPNTTVGMLQEIVSESFGVTDKHDLQTYGIFIDSLRQKDTGAEGEEKKTYKIMAPLITAKSMFSSKKNAGGVGVA